MDEGTTGKINENEASTDGMSSLDFDLLHDEKKIK